MNEAIRSAWTLRYGWERRYRRQKLSERLWMRLSDMLPRQLRYYTWIRVTADATTGPELSSQVVPAIPLDDLLRVTHAQLMERADGQG